MPKDKIKNYFEDFTYTNNSLEVNNNLYLTSYNSPTVDIWLDNNNAFNKRPASFNTILLKK